MAQLATGIVGIIANPAAGKDIRRIVAHATIVANHEKVNSVRRILLGLAATAVREVWYLPDAAGLVVQAAAGIDLPFALRPLAGRWSDSTADTTEAARALASLGAACLITLGGDGTARAAVKGSRTLPLLALSTGTNNAFPLQLEGTLAGLAAGSLATIAPTALTHLPVLELWHDDHLIDLALVDLATFDGIVGARAVWEMDRVKLVVTTRLHPGTIGLSALGGHLGEAIPDAALAVALELGQTGRSRLVPIAPGLMLPIRVERHTWLAGDSWFDLPTPTTLALDGEREQVLRAGERWRVRVVAAGVRVVDVAQALQWYVAPEGAQPHAGFTA